MQLSRSLSKASIWIWGALIALPSCGGAIGDGVRPTDFTGAGVVGGAAAACKVAPKLARPLVVDLDPDSRAGLQAGMKNGVVVVSYDCVNLRVLPNCHPADGIYSYAGVDRQENTIQMKNQDDLSVNLPLSAGKFGAQVQSGRSIDLALVLVGMSSTTVDKLKKSDLVGGCDGATHFLQQASLGAFAMATGSVGKAAAAAEVFKIGASGSSESTRGATNSSGSLEACRTSDSDAPEAPKGCKAPISLQLIALSADEAPNAPPPPAPPAPGSKDQKSEPEENPCREGYVFSKGICTRSAEQAHLCKADDVADCKTQCEEGSFESCYNYGLAVRNVEAAKPYLKKACENNVPEACGQYGYFLQDFMNQENPINAEATKFMRRGCKAGGKQSCGYLGQILSAWPWFDKAKDLPGGITAFDRACSLGEQSACWMLGDMYYKGEGLPLDKKKGLELLDQACAANYASACSSIAVALSTENPKRAFRASKQVCGQLKGITCDEAIDVMIATGHPKDAFETSVQTCGVWTYNCYKLGKLYQEGVGTPKNPAKATEMFTKACEGGKGSRSACEKIGVKGK